MSRRISGIPVQAVLALAVLILLASAACDRIGNRAPNRLNPTPEFGADGSISASQLWEMFQPNANSFTAEGYKNRWGVIIIDDVDAVTTGGVVIKRMPGQPATLEFRYNYPEYTDEIKRGDRVKVLCNVGGVTLTGNILKFDYCRPHPPEARPPRDR